MGHRAAVLSALLAADVAAKGYVLHVVPANGGGVDRYVRDICARRARDCILHAVADQCVFEAVAAKRFIPVDRERMADANAVAAFGHPSLMHAHSTLAPVREQVALLSKLWGIDYVVTLHDIDFAGTFGVIDEHEREARLDFVRHAAQRIVPSAFISGVLSAALGAPTTRELIENGVDVADSSTESANPLAVPGPFQIAVVGALGLHKGLNFLCEVSAALPPEIGVVIIGYADGQITPGWLQKDRLWVHGAFEPRDLSGLIRGYGARLALFPNRQPESYSYALSDVWRAGLPALGPTEGAIGERIARTGAGWTYETDSSAEGVAARTLQCLTRTDLQSTYVYKAAAALLSTKVMVERLNQQYQKLMRAAQKRQKPAPLVPHLGVLEKIAATQLNGHFFRSELTKLSGDLAFSQAQAANADRSLQSVTQEYDARGAWIATLEKALAECKAEIERIELARIAEHEQMEAARLNERVQAEAARLSDRQLSEAARDNDRAAAETDRVRDRELAETLRVKDRELAEALRVKDRELAEAARTRDLALAEAVRLNDLALAEAARINDLALAEAAREQDRELNETARERELAEQRAQAETAQQTAHAAHEQYAAKLQRDVDDTLAIAHNQQHLLTQQELMLEMIPVLVRRRMLARVERSIAQKSSQ